MKFVVINFIKSVIIGASALIPGVSGGTMAIALGIYDKLLRSVSRFNKNKKDNIMFLCIFAPGALVGILLFSRWVLWMFKTFELPMIYFFVGCVLGSIPMLFRRGGVKQIQISDALWVLLGYLCVTWVSGVPVGACVVDGNYLMRFVLLLSAGVIIAIAFILPGISTSYMLLMFGIYDATLVALQSMDIAFLLPIFFGCGIRLFNMCACFRKCNGAL